MSLTWGGAWALLGMLIVVLMGSPDQVGHEPPVGMATALSAAAALGFVLGAISGLVFAVMLRLLRPRRPGVGLFASVGTAGALVALLLLVLLQGSTQGFLSLATLLQMLTGAATAVAALKIAGSDAAEGRLLPDDGRTSVSVETISPPRDLQKMGDVP